MPRLMIQNLVTQVQLPLVLTGVTLVRQIKWLKQMILKNQQQTGQIVNMMKYNEDKILKEIETYIKSTYGQHYAQVKEGVQVQDLLRSCGIDKDFCQANAIKYLCRFGKKDGRNRKDLLKAVHYIVLLMNSEDQGEKK